MFHETLTHCRCILFSRLWIKTENIERQLLALAPAASLSSAVYFLNCERRTNQMEAQDDITDLVHTANYDLARLHGLQKLQMHIMS